MHLVLLDSSITKMIWCLCQQDETMLSPNSLQLIISHNLEVVKAEGDTASTLAW